MTTCNGSTALLIHSLMTWRIMLTLRSSALICGSQRMGLMGSILMEDLMASLKDCGPVWNLRVKRTMSGAGQKTLLSSNAIPLKCWYMKMAKTIFRVKLNLQMHIVFI